MKAKSVAAGHYCVLPPEGGLGEASSSAFGRGSGRLFSEGHVPALGRGRACPSSSQNYSGSLIIPGGGLPGEYISFIFFQRSPTAYITAKLRRRAFTAPFTTPYDDAIAEKRHPVSARWVIRCLGCRISDGGRVKEGVVVISVTFFSGTPMEKIGLFC